MTQAWKGALEEGKRKCKCVLKADGVWERKPVWQQQGEKEIAGEGGKQQKETAKGGGN